MQGGGQDPGAPDARGGATGGSGTELERITARLEQLAEELDANPGEQRAAELVAEAGRLAAEAGREVENALRGSAAARDA